MGTAGCKPIKSGNVGSDNEDAESAESVSIGTGVRVHQLEGNNFLGKLEDAGRMSYRGRSLWRRHSSNTTTGRGSTATGGSSSARSSCYSDLSSEVWQHQQQHLHQPQLQQHQQHQQFFSTAPAATGGSRSLDCVTPGRRVSTSTTGDAASAADNKSTSSASAAAAAAAAAAADASRMDLTTLLLQGFDPAAYELRIAERRLAKFGVGGVRRLGKSVESEEAVQQPVAPG